MSNITSYRSIKILKTADFVSNKFPITAKIHFNSSETKAQHIIDFYIRYSSMTILLVMAFISL